ncbi:unnamed protein product [Candidula unifasciata]|uniref:Stabilizer of axonemal microtubules 2 n=1 Tax=Candidula unifasciata TaxID=100452 RepID=A0A8S3YKN1_9EUPU|nr:unnamed protein product [Candidula unifasciata]
MPTMTTTNKLQSLHEPTENITELCDCGQHRCVQKPVEHEHREPLHSSVYTSTYRAIRMPRPRSSKRPQPPVRQSCPAPMMLSTSQREDFQNPGRVERVQPVTHDARYVPPKQPFEQVTFYSQEFTPKLINLEPVKHGTRPDLIRDGPGKFEDVTTNREHFKRWLPQPRSTFGELPSFVGSLLFPGNDPTPVSTTRQTFRETHAPPAVAAKAVADSLKLEGDHTFDTTHNATYRRIEGDQRARPLVQADHRVTGRHGQFLGISQTRHDFPGFKGRQPHPPKPADPPQATIDLTFHNRQVFETENRTVFQGHDVTKHPVPESCQKGGDEFKPPNVKFETETCHKRDYPRIDLTILENIHKKLPATSLELAARAGFDGQTTNNTFFHRWKVQPRVRYGDFHASMPYLPPQQPFLAQSVSQSVFVAQPTSPVHIYRHRHQPSSHLPAQTPAQFTSTGTDTSPMTFETEYRQQFQKKQRRPCPAAVLLMRQEVQRSEVEPPPQQQQQQLNNKHISQSTRTMSTQVKG